MGHNIALNQLAEKRRNAQRALDKAKKAGDQVGAKRHKKEVDRLDQEIANLK